MIQAQENQSSLSSVEDEAQKENESETSCKTKTVPIKEHTPLKFNKVVEPLKTSPPPRHNSLNNFCKFYQFFVLTLTSFFFLHTTNFDI